MVREHPVPFLDGFDALSHLANDPHGLMAENRWGCCVASANLLQVGATYPASPHVHEKIPTPQRGLGEILDDYLSAGVKKDRPHDGFQQGPCI